MVSTDWDSTLGDFGAFFMTPPSKSITTMLMTPLLAALFVFIGNRRLEGFRKTQEQRKIAKLIISSIQGHLENLERIFEQLNGTLFEKDISVIDAKINQIRDDHIYESAIKQIGIFELKEVDILSDYSRALNSILSDTIKCSKKEAGIGCQRSVKKKIRGFAIVAKTNIMILSKRILQDKDKFNEYKELVKNDYAWIRIDGEIFFNPAMYGSLGSSDILEKTELLFKEMGLFAELEDAYKTKKQEYKKWVETEKSLPDEKSE